MSSKARRGRRSGVPRMDLGALLAVLAGVLIWTAASASATTLCLAKKANGAVKGPTTVGGSTCKSGYEAIELPSANELEVLKHATYESEGIDKKPTVVLSGVNVQVESGAGKEEDLNGEGNLVVGYDEHPPAQTGSNNLVVGTYQLYESYGGFLAGYENALYAPFAAVSGGGGNAADNDFSSVSGGVYNYATGYTSSIAGGFGNAAEGSYSSVAGGSENKVGGEQASISGGHLNRATAKWDSVSGGFENHAEGEEADSISGGLQNKSTGKYQSWIGGGADNTASGNYSSVFGGKGLSASGSYEYMP